jgi:hypothetical protein
MCVPRDTQSEKHLKYLLIRSLTTYAECVPFLYFQKEGMDGIVAGDGGIPAGGPIG